MSIVTLSGEVQFLSIGSIRFAPERAGERVVASGGCKAHVNVTEVSFVPVPERLRLALALLGPWELAYAYDAIFIAGVIE